MSSANPRAEARRLYALREYEVLDTPPDGAFDRVTALAARFFDTPISLISLVDQDRIWFKSKFGLEIDEVDRNPGLCSSAIMTDEAYVVENTIEDPRTLDNPLVAGNFGLRFYAAAPLVTKGGHGLGTINVMDFEPRTFSREDEQALEDFADIVMEQMELRLSARVIVEQLCRTFAEPGEGEESTSSSPSVPGPNGSGSTTSGSASRTFWPTNSAPRSATGFIPISSKNSRRAARGLPSSNRGVDARYGVGPSTRSIPTGREAAGVSDRRAAGRLFRKVN